MSDWERAKKNIAEDAPIPYGPNDPDDGLYDPNDDEAVDRFLTEANRVYPPAPATSADEDKKIAKASY